MKVGWTKVHGWKLTTHHQWPRYYRAPVSSVTMADDKTVLQACNARSVVTRNAASVTIHDVASAPTCGTISITIHHVASVPTHSATSSPCCNSRRYKHCNLRHYKLATLGAPNVVRVASSRHYKRRHLGRYNLHGCKLASLLDSDGGRHYSTTMVGGATRQRWRAMLLDNDGRRHCAAL